MDGTPHKGNKSKWSEKLKAHYNNTSAFMSVLEWVPEVVIIDSMFMININPLRQHKTLNQYADLLFRQYAIYHIIVVVHRQYILYLTIQLQETSIPKTLNTKEDTKK